MNREDNQRELIVRMFQASNSLQTYLDQLLKSDHLTSKQFYMMIFIGAFEHDPRIGELSDAFGTSRQNVKQVVIKLQKQGFVDIYKDEHDSRISRIRLTAHAKDYWQHRNSDDDVRIAQLFEHLSDSELDCMRNGLMKVLNQLENLRKQGETIK